MRPPRTIHDVYHQVVRATIELTHTVGGSPTVSDIADHLALGVDLAVTLDAVVCTLTPRNQQLLQLRFDHDLTQQEIGNRLDISQMQVSRLLSALTSRLRDQLANVA